MEARAVHNADHQREVEAHQRTTLQLREAYDEMQLDIAHHRAEQGLADNTADNKPKGFVDEIDSTLVYHDVAESLRLKGDLDGALPYYQKTIELRRAKFGVASTAISPVLVNYAELLRQLERYEDAKAALDEALTINVRYNGKRHEATAEIINNLGMICRYLGDLESGEALLLEALSLRRELFGDLDVSVGATLNNVAELYRERGDFFQAINFHNLSIEAFDKAVGPDHPGTVNAKGNLGITLRRYSAVNLEQGESLLRETVDYLQTNEYGQQHPWTKKYGSEHILNHAERLQKEGKHEEALELFDSVLQKKQVVQQLITAIANEDLSSATSPVKQQDVQLLTDGKIKGMLGKARNLIKKALHSEAREILHECASFPQQVLGSNHTHYIQLKELMAENDMGAGLFADVNQCLAEVLTSKIDLYGPDHVSLVETMILLAEYYRGQARYDDATTFYTQAITLVNFTLKNDLSALGAAEVGHKQLFIRATLGMADLQRNLGYYLTASQMVTEVETECKEYLIIDDPLNADVLLTRAAFAKLRGDYPTAKELYTSALDIRTRNFGRKHPKSASVIDQLGQIELTLCNFKEAESLIDEALATREAAYQGINPNHPAIAASQYSRAKLYQVIYKVERAHELMMLSLEMRKAVLPEEHTAVAQSLFGLADVLRDRYQVKEAMGLYELALRIRRDAFHHNAAHHEYVAESLIGMAKGLQWGGYLQEALLVFEEGITVKEDLMNQLDLNYSDVLGRYLMQYSNCLLMVGRAPEAQTNAAKSGVHMFQIFKNDAHLRVGDALLHTANAYKAQGRFKDAKNQYSIAFAIRLKALGNEHNAVWEVMGEACDNMRSVGYYTDAFEAINAAENLIKIRFPTGNKGIEAVYSIIHANVFSDKGKPILAEPLLEAAQKIATEQFGENSIHALWAKVGLGKAYLYQNKLTKSEASLTAAFEHAQQILDAKSPLLYDIMSDLAFLKYFQRKPVEQSIALNTLRDEILPFYTAEFGMANPYIAHTKGRVGLFMNKAKKDSGKKQVFEALKIFDNYKQYPHTYDHPWVLELGGYEKTSSKERVSSKVEEFAVAPWSVPSYEGDTNYGVPPKHIWVDLKNYSEEAWGGVMYYAVEKGVSIAPTANEPPTTPFDRMRTPKKVRRDKAATRPSTATTTAIHMVDEDTPADEGGVPNFMSSNEAELLRKTEELLAEETAKRQKLADELEAEKAARLDAEESVVIEQKEKEIIQAELANKEAEVEAMEAKALAEIQKALAEAAEKAEEEMARVRAELEAEIEKQAQVGTFSAIFDDIKLEDGVTMDAHTKSEMEASQVLYNRATALASKGLYRKAQPLFEECYIIRNDVIPTNPITGDALLAIAVNSDKQLLWEQALAKYDEYLGFRERNEDSGTQQTIFDVELAKLLIFVAKGGNEEGTEQYKKLLKRFKTLVTDYNVQPFFAEVLRHQAWNMSALGKLGEAKATVERSQALNTKLSGVNSMVTTDSMSVRAELLIHAGKGKEAIMMMEQVMATRKKLLSENVAQSQGGSSIDKHPLIADTLLLLGRANFLTGKGAWAPRPRALHLRRGFVREIQGSDWQYPGPFRTWRA